ncbi:ester cyclase [Deminuibacter soli]|uniref:Ester cyclase n=1 Tax=Deminuibacter soli TaxID=2291815 RepID=A0A3E1NDY8_9BACT|nr:ester cyclase [Deminuibacter soli]RFM26179.1 ester cyclase [Deminuibacter soli]
MSLTTKLFIIVVLIFTLSSTKAQQQDTHKNVYSTKMKTSETLERNKETIRHLYEDLLNERQFDQLASVVSEEYVGIRGEKGVKGFSEAVTTIVAGFPDMKWTIEDLLADNDKVIVRWSWKGNNTQPFRGIPASNKPVTDNAIVIYQFNEGGKIVHAWMQGDRLGVLLQIGAIPANLIPSPPQSPKN